MSKAFLEGYMSKSGVDFNDLKDQLKKSVSEGRIAQAVPKDKSFQDWMKSSDSVPGTTYDHPTAQVRREGDISSGDSVSDRIKDIIKKYSGFMQQAPQSWE